MLKRIMVFLIAAAAAACMAVWAQGGGNVKGTVKNRWVEKFPIVVYIDEIAGKKFAPPSKPAHIDQRGKVFIPRVLPVLVGTKVDFLNNNPFEHNVYSPDHEKYNLGNWKKGEVRSYTYKNPGVYTQLCKMHPEMIAYVVVVKTPYFAVTDKAGNFTLKGVPPGTYKLKVWGERLRPNQLEKTFEVKVEAGKEASVTIEP
jgi:plastocyanin